MTRLLPAAQRLAQVLEAHRPHARLHRAALHNAHAALDEIRHAVADRQVLQGKGERHLVHLSHEEALDLLSRQSVGRMAYVAREGVPDVVPVNFTWSEGVVLIRSGPGPKLQAAQRGDLVALEVDEIDVDRRVGMSVVVLGRAEIVPPHVPVPDVDMWAGGPRRHTIRIVPTRIAGRRLG